MHNPKRDVTHRYTYVKSDFVKHLTGTTLVVAILAVGLSISFREPVRPALKIQTVATTEPLLFEKVTIGDLAGTGKIASYGPPYNHGTSSVQSPLQRILGVIHPVNAAEDFVLKPLAMAAVVDPDLSGALARWNAAPIGQRDLWSSNYAKALADARVAGRQVVVPPGQYGRGGPP